VDVVEYRSADYRAGNTVTFRGAFRCRKWLSCCGETAIGCGKPPAPAAREKIYFINSAATLHRLLACPTMHSALRCFVVTLIH